MNPQIQLFIEMAAKYGVDLLPYVKALAIMYVVAYGLGLLMFLVVAFIVIKMFLSNGSRVSF